jgi:hypothetical protein
MRAIEFSSSKGWKFFCLNVTFLWLFAFSKYYLVLWSLQNRWSNCLNIIRGFWFRVSHIYRERSSCADKLANRGFQINSVTWMNFIPNFISYDFVRNKNDLPFFHFCCYHFGIFCAL